MQRANGDWFALLAKGDLRMTVFRSAAEAMLARSLNTEMECFRPAVLDERALNALKATDNETVSFSIVDDASRKLARARPISFRELTGLSSSPKEPKEASR